MILSGIHDFKARIPDNTLGNDNLFELPRDITNNITQQQNILCIHPQENTAAA